MLITKVIYGTCKNAGDTMHKKHGSQSNAQNERGCDHSIHEAVCLMQFN
jgi:hypothetical protein